jgi:multidrug efflux system membrane fusion protein
MESSVCEVDDAVSPRAKWQETERPTMGKTNPKRRPLFIAAGVLIAAGAAFGLRSWNDGAPVAPLAVPPPMVTVSVPLSETVAQQSSFLGQFSAVETVDIRAQVGGILTAIRFKDGQIVNKGDPLFAIDSRPYEIRLAQATAQVQSAQARLALTKRELTRAQDLKRSDFGTAQSVDQRLADQQAAQAALDQAVATSHDAQLDLDYATISAPFTGRISAHRVSVGNLISGSRAGTTPTTSLTTLVSLDPIHLDFDMSEADYLAYQRAHRQNNGAISDTVDVSLDDEAQFTRHGQLDFIDNALDRSSGTIHARATIPNPDLFIAPGQFAKLRLNMGSAKRELLVPDAALVLDQSQSVVMTVSAEGNVVPKKVEIGALHGSLRVIRTGLEPTDRVVVDGLVRAQAGTKVTTQPGAIRFASEGGQQG